jgi:hypothetical protein
MRYLCLPATLFLVLFLGGCAVTSQPNGATTYTLLGVAALVVTPVQAVPVYEEGVPDEEAVPDEVILSESYFDPVLGYMVTVVPDDGNPGMAFYFGPDRRMLFHGGDWEGHHGLTRSLQGGSRHVNSQGQGYHPQGQGFHQPGVQQHPQGQVGSGFNRQAAPPRAAPQQMRQAPVQHSAPQRNCKNC